MILQAFLWLFPWAIRRRILNAVYHWDIHPTAIIRPFTIIRAKFVRMEKSTRIGKFVFVNSIDRLIIHEGGVLSKGCVVVGYPESGKKCFTHVENRKCELILGKNSSIVRHRFDCTAGIYIGDFTTVAGLGSQFFTHSIDVYNNRQDAKPIHIGKYCMLGSRCIVLPGSKLPDYCVLGAGSVLTTEYEESGVVYVGSPAKPVKKLDIDKVGYFHREVLDVY